VEKGEAGLKHSHGSALAQNPSSSTSGAERRGIRRQAGMPQKSFSWRSHWTSGLKSEDESGLSQLSFVWRYCAKCCGKSGWSGIPHEGLLLP